MLLIPAIDLKDGHCVRLQQGDMAKATTFGEDPAAVARSWLEKGARRLHLVDLNGAFAGKPQNFAAIKSILRAVGDDIPVQLGGGIRDLDTIEKYIDGGLRYVIIGTAAVQNDGPVLLCAMAHPANSFRLRPYVPSRNVVGLIVYAPVNTRLLTTGFCICVSLNPGSVPLMIWFRCAHPEYFTPKRSALVG